MGTPRSQQLPSWVLSEAGGFGERSRGGGQVEWPLDPGLGRSPPPQQLHWVRGCLGALSEMLAQLHSGLACVL